MKIKQYNSGLRVVHNEKKDIDVVSFNIFVKAGSANEQPHQYGLAHFCEHMFFKSTDKHTYQEINDILDETGTRKNAFTGYFRTCYYFKTLSKFIEKNIQIYSEMLFNTKYFEDEIQNEKNVVLEELKMGEDDSDRSVANNAYETMFANSILSHKIIGKAETIKAFTEKDLIEFKKCHYTPENIVISVSGNISFRMLEKYLKKHFAPLFEGVYDGDYKDFGLINVNIKNSYVTKNKDNEQSVIYILYDLGDVTEQDKYIYDLYLAILGYGMGSKLFNKVRIENGLVYSIFSSSFSLGKNYLANIDFATSYTKVSETLNLVLKILKECSEGNITQKELDIARNKYIAGLVFSNEENSGIALRNGSELISENEILSDKSIIEKLNSVTLEQVLEFAKKLYNNKNFVVSSVGKSTVEDLKVYE